MEDDRKYTVRVDTNPPLYFGPYTKAEADAASGTLQERFMHETATYMLVASSDDSVTLAVEFNRYPNPQRP